MLPWLYYLILAAVLIGGVYITLFNLPGLWAMVLGTTVYAILTHFQYAGLRTLIVIIVLATIAELIDLIAAGAGAKKAGASKRGLWGAILGGIAGGIFFTVPLPVIGTIIGICLGTFAGAILGELLGGTEVGNSVRIGVGAAWGRLLGILTKLLFGCTILATVLITALPPIFHRSHAATLLPPITKSPATSPVK